jgi:hypothetical protein
MSKEEAKTKRVWPWALKEPHTERVFAGVHASSLFLGHGWKAASEHFTVKEFHQRKT